MLRLLTKKTSVPFTYSILDWMNERVLTEKNILSADDAWLSAAQKFPDLKGLNSVPQSPPWHSEGAIVSDHVKRMLATLFALSDNVSLLEIEELKREKNFADDILHLQLIMKEKAASLYAFCLLHDIGKVETATFEAHRHSEGAGLSLFQHKHRKHEKMSSGERDLFLKLFRGMHAKYPHAAVHEVMGAFYDKYEIEVHYPNHAAISSSRESADLRRGVGEWLRLSERDIELVNFLIKYHVDAIEFFQNPSATKMQVMIDRAHRAGFDAGDAMDLMACVLFLDVVCGSVHYEHGEHSSDYHVFLSFLRSEDLLMAKHRQVRKDRIQQQEQAAFKDILHKHNLSSDEIFQELQIPFGPERASFIERVHSLIRGPHKAIDPDLSALESRIHHARKEWHA